MQILNELLGFVDNPRFLTVIIILLVSVIIFILKAFANNVMKQFKNVLDGEKVKWTDVNNRLDEIRVTLETMDSKLKLNNDTTISLVYHQCFNEAMKWKEKGTISLGAKKYFDKMWDNYLELGDGLGTEPKDIVDALKVEV